MEISAFTKALERHCASRENGKDSRGSTKGSHNSKLLEVMPDIRAIADLQALRRSPTSGILKDVDAAQRRLLARRIIPECVAPGSLRVAYEAIKATEDGLSNPRLYQELWKAAAQKPELKPFVALVTRLWLCSPTESVVESMASVAKEVFGAHRQLSHENAAKELVVRWNGPDTCSADWLVTEVQRRHKYNFTRSATSIMAAVEGTVIARHRSTPSVLTAVFKAL